MTNTGRRNHISPILASLHSLPLNFRTDFKILLITFKALHGQAPSYIPEMYSDIPYEPQRTLRPLSGGFLVVPPARLATKRDQALSVCAPQLWNSNKLDRFLFLDHF